MNIKLHGNLIFILFKNFPSTLSPLFEGIQRIFKMAKVKQNVVLLIEPSGNDYNVSFKAGNMLLNRFCIDEDAAFESTGVYYLKSSKKYRFVTAKGQSNYILNYGIWKVHSVNFRIIDLLKFAFYKSS